jgi:CheY-like chemotaxis protein
MSVLVLLVEDNDANADMLSRRLARHGFDVRLARDGRMALTMAHELTPALILMDISLPEIDGWETTRRLKASPATALIPVIALTAHAMVSDREKCLAAGCDEFETKPIDLRRLLDKMQALLVTGARP